MSRVASQERGQVLVIFAFGLVGILAVAALVFDVGHDIVERRIQQKSADAAALAGSRYLTLPACKAGNDPVACAEAVEAAVELATRNGYTDGTGTVEVDVKIPPGPESKFASLPGHIQVTIAKTRPSFFAGILGFDDRRVSTIAVAANVTDVSIAHSMIALNPTVCQAGKFGGNGTISVEGSIQIDSSCPTDAMHGAGTNVSLHAPNCYVVGGWEYHAKSDVNCGYPADPPEPPQQVPQPAGDPLASLTGPTLTAAGYPNPPKAVEILFGTGKADGCPDGKPYSTTSGGTLELPKTCKLGAKGTAYRVHPGVYFGGISIQGNNSDPTKIYFEPGLYYLAGGGFKITGGAAYIMTVDASWTPSSTWMTPGGGFLLYNTDDPYYRTVCSDPAYVSVGCIGAISMSGNDSIGFIEFYPYQHDPYRNLLIYQDRDATRQPAIDINGEGRDIRLHGTIYAPEALVKVTGNGESISTQIIADSWHVSGNGAVDITYDANAFVKLRGIGLVQ